MISGQAAAPDAWAYEAPRLRLADHLPGAIDAAAIAVGRLTARACETRYGITIAEWRMIALVAETGPAPELDVLSRSASDQAHARRTVRSLARRGLARIADRHVSLTPDGEDVYAEIAPLVLAYEATLLTGLSPGEVIALKHLLQRVRSAADRLQGLAG